jgi:hypothetical protein
VSVIHFSLRSSPSAAGPVSQHRGVTRHYFSHHGAAGRSEWQRSWLVVVISCRLDGKMAVKYCRDVVVVA